MKPRFLTLVASTMTAGLAVALAPGSAAAAPRFAVGPTGSITVTARGNGHGHGMSQYGAKGAAQAGLNYQQILAFYYPGTTLTTVKPTSIRVRLSGFGSSPTVGVSKTLTVTGVSGFLPTAGVARYRLAPSGAGFALQRFGIVTGSTWSTIRTGLPNNAQFHDAAGGPVRLYQADGSSTAYLGYVRAVRSGASAYPVNQVDLESYVAGVVPRESPAYWPAQALSAQAVAARSYARYAIEHKSSASTYDICDTTACQVYGGLARYSTRGALKWTQLASAARFTSRQVLRYQGATIFAQFSASNGGWTTDGGQPYLVAKADPYDNAASGDPYLLYSEKIPVSSLGGLFGLARATGITLTKQDGHGAWGGRTVTATVDGVSPAGRPASVVVSGSDMQAAFGLGTTWMAFSAG